MRARRPRITVSLEPTYETFARNHEPEGEAGDIVRRCQGDFGEPTAIRSQEFESGLPCMSRPVRTVLLSGGIDSSTLVALCAEQRRSGIRALFVDYGQAAAKRE